MSKKRKSLVGHNTSSEQTTRLRSKWNSINCKNIVKQCEKLSYSYWFIDRDFDDLSNGDYSQQSIALIAIIFVSAITLLIPSAECVPRPSFFQIFDYFYEIVDYFYEGPTQIWKMCVHRSGKWSHVPRCTFINEPVFETVKAKKSLKCPWLPPPFRL